MKKIGVLVGEKGNWSFFRDIFDKIDTVYQTDVFKEKIYSTPLLYGRLNRWAFQNGIRQILRRNNLCFFEWASELLVPASHMPKYCPIITRLHSYEIFFWAPRINWENVDKVILVSQAMKNKFIELYPNQANKADVVYCGQSLNKFLAPARNDFGLNLGMLCSINPRKGVYNVVLLVSQLKKMGFHPHLHIGGEQMHGPDVDEYFVAIQRLIQKLKLEDDVTLYGKVIDTAGWLQKIDIFISNSYWEGLQVALIEAMASGCYCLSHCWGGVEEALPPENIYISDNELLEKIIEYHNHSFEQKNIYRHKMRAIAEEKFDIEMTKTKILDIINTAL